MAEWRRRVKYIKVDIGTGNGFLQDETKSLSGQKFISDILWHPPHGNSADNISNTKLHLKIKHFKFQPHRRGVHELPI